MSLSVLVICDRCLRPFAGSNVPVQSWNRGPDRATGHVLRREAKEEGWAVTVDSWAKRSRQGWRDFCPHCLRDGRIEDVADLSTGELVERAARNGR